MYANRFYIFYLRLIYLEILKVLKVYRNSMPICLALSKQLDQPPPDVQPPIYTKWPLRLFSRSVFVYCILYTVFVFFFLLRELGPWGWAHEFSSHLQPRARTCYDTHRQSTMNTTDLRDIFTNYHHPATLICIFSDFISNMQIHESGVLNTRD